MTTLSLRPMLAALLAALLFGASTPAAKVLLGPVGPFTLAGLLYLGAALAMLPWAWRFTWFRRMDRRNGALVAGAVVFGGVLGPVLLLSGLRLAPAAAVSLWLNLESVATALFAWMLFREHVSGRVWAGAGLVCAASVLLAAPERFTLGLAALLVALAAASWGLDNSFTALIDRLTPAQTTFVKGLAAGATNLALGAWLGEDALAVNALVPALAIGALSYGVSVTLYVASAQQLGATRSQFIFSTAPFWGVGFSWVALGEPVRGVEIAAAALMAAALAVVYAGRHEHAHTHRITTHVHGHRHDDGHHDHLHEDTPPDTWHTHEHSHAAQTHVHPHQPDLHHRHGHA